MAYTKRQSRVGLHMDISVENSLYDAIFVLGGGIVKRGDSFVPTTYSDSDPFGMLGGEIRIYAAVEMCKVYPGVPMVFTTGTTAKTIAQYGPDVPSEASVYSYLFSEELQAHNTPLPQIVLEERSENTASNVREALVIAKENKWHKIAVISSDYHQARVALLFTLFSGSSTLLDITYLSAEAVVRELCPGRYDAKIAAAYRTDEAKRRIQNEAQGVAALRSGSYSLGEFQLA